MKTNRSTSLHAATLLAALSLPSTVLAGPLPGGAGSLVETYQDWVVACQAPNNTAACVMRQVQSNTQTGQHVLTAELRNTADGKLEGALLLPFGLALAQGVALKIDDKPDLSLSFSTCLPTGCIAPMSLDADQVAALKAGSVLSLAAMSLNPNRTVPFKISLSGFTAALNRVTELIK